VTISKRNPQSPKFRLYFGAPPRVLCIMYFRASAEILSDSVQRSEARATDSIINEQEDAMDAMTDRQETTTTTTNAAMPGVQREVAPIEIASLIVEALNLGVKPEDIEPDGALFDDGLGLDSIDALEIALTLQRVYGVSITQGEEQNKEIFRSLNSLAEFVNTYHIK
jgi:acyl carrier protein